MSTAASTYEEQLWQLISNAEPRAKLGGIVGDAVHQAEYHSYHESWDDQTHDGGYSVHYRRDTHIAPEDQGYASAIDITLPPELMIKYTKRLKRWAKLRRLHLARINLYNCMMEFAGTLNGSVVFSMDTHAAPYRTTGFDSSHLWHIHISIARCYANDPRILSIAQIFTDSQSERAKIRAKVKAATSGHAAKHEAHR